MKRLLAGGLALALLGSLSGCRKKSFEAAQGGPVTRVSPTGKPRPAVPDPKSRERLQELVMIQQEGGGAFQTRETHSKPVDAGALQLSLRGLATSHTLTARSLEMTSEDLYVRVGVLLVNSGKSAEPVDLRFAQLRRSVPGAAVDTVTISRSAQQAEPRPLKFELMPGEKVERTLYFEATQAVLQPGLSLAFPASALAPAETAMELL